MEPLLALRERARARWTAAGTRERALFLAGIATLVALGILGYAQASRTPMSVLFSGLAEGDAAGIVARLRETHVPYEIGPDGTTISVPTANVHETRLALAADGLPAGGGIGFEIFDTQRFGESEFVEQVQYLRALEGELGRTIGALGGVDSARVHLVLPQRSLIGNGDEHARASIAVRMQPGHHLAADQVRGIVHLVASSVRDLDPTNVTVVDGEGRRLAGGDDEDSSETAHDAVLLRERIEHGRERAIQDLLDSMLGVGAAIARLSADVSFTQEERLEESYDPERSATRSFELTTEGAATDTGATSGVAGAVSALPGGPAAESVTADATGGRRVEVRNFEITKMVRREIEPLGRVVRLSLAVVVDGTWQGEGDARHFVPRTEEELARIRAVVSSAAGLVESRGDTLTVECVPLVPAVVDPEALAASAPAAIAAWQYAALGGFVLLLALGSVLWMRRRRLTTQPIAIVGEPALPGGLATVGATATALSTDAPEPEPDADAIRIRVIEFARRDPELAARIVRGWLGDGEPALTASAAPSTAASGSP
jgi:flagellar M-ring protein FliF